ncbi:corepressor interacting with RBPJ 1 [Bacillus rossius redtenbacheri]|uniref:corepressor interacting with RBPJ 1 n=1 Tax=Bacillus rossius redtenbacheri TaxID=93214 RepID=UPI002FDD43E9
MGKGFNNYMCKKFFHPASRDNLKRVWMAEQKADSYKKKQEELRVQYEKEQDLYTNKALLSKESKDKLSVNFMYEPPPGTKKEREREDDEPEYKFEWQRKFNAPREDYCKGDSEIRDQPFGIQVRNVRCIKCHKWGHINTDKECPMYNQSSSADTNTSSLDPLLLVQQMREDGLAMKRSALDMQQQSFVPANHQLVDSDSEDDCEGAKKSELEFLKSLSTKQKRKLLKKLEKLEKKGRNGKSGKDKTGLKKVKKEAKSSGSSSDTEHERKHKREKKVNGVRVKGENKREKCDSSDQDKSLEQVLGRSIKFEGHSHKHSGGGKSEKKHEHKRKHTSTERKHTLVERKHTSAVSNDASSRKHARK